MAMKTNLKYLYSCRPRFRDKDEVKPSPAGLSSLPASSFWIANLRDLSTVFVLAISVLLLCLGLAFGHIAAGGMKKRQRRDGWKRKGE
jgi:hypothetical protein